MLAMEELLCELTDHEKRNKEQGLPPGFRFHPTDEELITFYLASKVFHGTFTDVKFVEVDLNRCEPWELPEVAKMGEREWYLFSVRDRKYPTGLRTNRATGAGYWKATGKDKEVFSAAAASNGGGMLLIGMKKTLVFYRGRAPRGEKTKWVMHEYRLDGHFSPSSLSHPPHTSCNKQEWVICRIFHKSGEKRGAQHLDASSSPPTKSNFTPPSNLLASPITSFAMEQQQQEQNDHLSHSHNNIFPSLHTFQLPSFPNIAAASATTLKAKEEQTVPKTEATFYDQYHHSLLNPLNPISNFVQNSISLFPLDQNMDAAVGLMPFSGGSYFNNSAL